jgi:hypothetical protein
MESGGSIPHLQGLSSNSYPDPNQLNSTNYGLWNPEVQSRIHKGSPVIPILSRINSISGIDIYFIKVHSNIVFNLRLGQDR